MKRNILSFFTLVVLTVSNAAIQAAEYSAWVEGETWRYKHEGPVPFRGEDSTVVGDRVIRVLNVTESNGATWWTLKENYGENDDAPRTFKVDANRSVHTLLWGDDEIRYEPPMPMDYSALKSGEEQIDDVLMKFGDGGFKSTIAAKRLPDQDVTVPAGSFEQCVHVKIVMTLHFGDLKLPIDHEVWYHPNANFIVKELYQFKEMQVGSMKWGSHTCLSELKEYTRPAAE